MIKKINDERLKLKNLENIRIVFIVQTLGIIALLGYDVYQNGFGNLTKNPLWFVLILSAVVSSYLSMSVSVDHEAEGKSPKKGLNISIIVLIIISVVIATLVALTDGFHLVNGLLIGGIIFICGLAPAIYLYFLRKRRMEDDD